MPSDAESKDRIRIWADAKSDLQTAGDQLDQLAELFRSYVRELTLEREDIVVQGTAKRPIYQYPSDFDNLPDKDELISKYGAFADAKLRESMARSALVAREKRALELS